MNDKFAEYIDFFNRLRLREALKAALDIGDFSNKFIQESAIWDKGIDQKALEVKLWVLVNVIRLIGVLLEPFVPSLSAKLFYLLNHERTLEDETLIGRLHKETDRQAAILGLVKTGHEIRQSVPLVTPGELISG